MTNNKSQRETARETDRGFRIVEFQDYNGVMCNIQESSLATEPAIWLGCKELGLIHFVSGEGWKPIENLPPRTMGNTRMHLTQKQAADLMPYLLEFVLFGTVGDIDNETEATNKLTAAYKEAARNAELAEDGGSDRQYFRWAYSGVVCLAQIFLQAANDRVENTNDWPAGQTWSQLNGSSRSIFLRLAREALGIPHDEFLAPIRLGQIEIDDLYEFNFATADAQQRNADSQAGTGYCHKHEEPLLLDANGTCDQCNADTEPSDPMKCKCLFWATTNIHRPMTEHHPLCDGTGHHKQAEPSVCEDRNERHEIEPPYPCYDCDCQQFKPVAEHPDERVLPG